MSQENVKLVKRAIDAWNRGERSLPDDPVHPEVEVLSRFRPEPYRGRDGFEQWMREIDEQFAEWRLAIDDWRSTGNRVVALGQLHLRGRAGACSSTSQLRPWSR
jgi:hypothetical protein